MLWNGDGVQLDPSTLGELSPSEVLYEFDGPKIFTSLDRGRMLLAYECDNDDDERVARYLVCPTSEAIIQKLKSGMQDVRAALDQPWLHVVDQSYNRKILRVLLLPHGLASVPETQKPKSGTLLWSHLRSQDSIDILKSSHEMVKYFIFETKRFASYANDLHEITSLRATWKGKGESVDNARCSRTGLAAMDPSKYEDANSVAKGHVISDIEEAGLDYIKARKNGGFNRPVVSRGNLRSSIDWGRPSRVREQKH